MTTSMAATAFAAFFGSFVECVEALTIVLAVGIVRGWREALLGAAAGLLVLMAVTVAAGSGLLALPLGPLRAIMGALLLLFGLRWLRKAVLRAAGRMALRDEDRAFSVETAALEARMHVAGRLDRVALTASFNAVLIEGLEVVFIVVAIGAGGGSLLPAGIGATVAAIIVLVAGIALHRPLARVPENALKFIVGVQLTAFGIFWLGKAAGFAWPGGDAALLGLSAIVLALAVLAARVLKPAQTLVGP